MALFARLVFVLLAVSVTMGSVAAQTRETREFVITGVKYRTTTNSTYVFKACDATSGIADVPKSAKDYDIFVVGTYTPVTAGFSGTLYVEEDGGGSTGYIKSGDPTKDGGDSSGNWTRTIPAGDLVAAKTYSLWTKTGSNSNSMTVNGAVVPVAAKKLTNNNN